jgi:hypothetical protein
MIMEPHAGDPQAGPRAAGEPRSRLHGSNGPPPRRSAWRYRDIVGYLVAFLAFRRVRHTGSRPVAGR